MINRTHLKNNLSGICLLLFIVLLMAGFSSKNLVFDGGKINNPFITIPPNTIPPPITATEASGCAGTISYQWQQSLSDTTHFIDIDNANGMNYQPQTVTATTYFRRKATCQGGGTAYTSNIATAVIVLQSQ